MTALRDPLAGRRMRAVAVALTLACAVTCARGGEPQRPPTGSRIVSIGGPVTEIVFALGKGDHVVAVDTSSVFPPEVTRLPQIGYQRTLSAESVLAHAPDLVVATADAGPPAALDQLRAAGVAVEIIPTALTIEAAGARIEAVGAALGVRPMASDLADRVRRHATQARAGCCAADHRTPRALLVYARGGGTVMVAGSDTPAAAMLELAGARNAATGFTGYKALSPEILVDAAPEVIVVPSRGLASLGGEAGLLALPGVAHTPAGRDERIVAMDDLLMLGFGPRLAAAIDELSRRLAPGAGRGPGAMP
jgi:iron complex transport system substrate-binding protein